jgi:methyl-accepting chemotaxis protein
VFSVKPLFKRFQQVKRFEKSLYGLKDRSLKANWYDNEENIYNVFCEIRDITKNIHNIHRDLIKEFRSHDGKVSEIRDITKNIHGDLIAEFRSFEGTVSENASKAIITALNKIIQNFSQKITEQLGDNFKNFNSAVGELVQWQKNYKNELKSLSEQFNRSLQGIETVRNSLKEISDSVKPLSDITLKLKQIAEVTDIQIQHLKKELESFSELGSQALRAFPIIDKNLREITEEFSNVVKTNLDIMKDSLESQKKGVKTFTENTEQVIINLKSGFSELEKQMKDSTVQVSEKVHNLLDKIQSEILQILKNQDKEVQKTFGNIQNTIQSIMKENNEILQKQVGQLDKQMEQEIGRIIEEMAFHLTRLSEKFVKDYAPLTERLHDLIEIARKPYVR